MLPGESLHSMLLWDIPWWRPDHAIFFGVVYAVLIAVALVLGMVILRSLAQTIEERLHNGPKRQSFEVIEPGQDTEESSTA